VNAIHYEVEKYEAGSLVLSFKFDGFVKSPFNVISAQAGIQKRLKTLDRAKASLRARPAPE
jgi:hypothetical protein